MVQITNKQDKFENTETEVIQGVREWDRIRNTEKGYYYLTSGLGFGFSKSNYEKWLQLEKDTGKSITTINCHLGIWEDRLFFFFVDSITGSLENGQVGENIFISSFHTKVKQINITEPTSKTSTNASKIIITQEEAKDRLMKWVLCSKQWFDKTATSENQENAGIVKYFKINFENFKVVFAETNNLYSFFGIKEDKIHGQMIDLMLCSQPNLTDIKSGIEDWIFTNVTKPIPPFSPW